MRFITDVPTALSDLLHGEISVRSYYNSLKNTRVESVFAKDDPLPFFGEMILLPYLVAKKYF